mgnify:FL=1
MKKYGFYPSFLSKQGYLFKAAKSKFKFLVKVNLFKQNNFVKIPKSKGGGKQIRGSRFGSWGIINHLIEYDNPGIYVYYKSVANTQIHKMNKFKQLKMELN